MRDATTDHDQRATHDGRPTVHAVAAGLGLLVAAGVLAAWSTGATQLTDLGLEAATTPWTAVMFAALATATLTVGGWRLAALTAAALLAAVALLAAPTSLAAQQLLFPASTAVSSPGAAVLVGLLVAALAHRRHAPVTSVGLVLAAVSLATMSVVGAVLGSGWTVAAGATDATTGMAVPTVLLALLTVAAILTLPEGRHDHGPAWLASGPGMLLVGVSVVSPWIGVLVAGDTGRAGYLAAACATALVVVLIARSKLLGGLGEGAAALEGLLDVVPDAMLLVDERGAILRCNDQMAALTGHTREQLQTMSIEELVPVASRFRHRGLRERYDRAPETRRMGRDRAVTLARADGSEVPVEVALSPVRVGGRDLVTAIARDASEQRTTEQTLLRLERMRRVFLESVSHELRTPLAVIRGFAEVLQTDRLDAATRGESGLRLVGAVDRLDELLTDLLDVQQLERGGLVATSRHDAAVVEALLGKVLHDVPDAVDATIHVAPDAPTVACNQTLLERVAVNLLSNAAKYAPGPVEVVVEGSQGGWLLRVDDHGRGLPPRLRDTVFQPFDRGERTDLDAPGVGIGLSLVAGIAHAHGGRAWATGRDDGAPGTSFRFWLPQAPDQPVGDRGQVASVAAE